MHHREHCSYRDDQAGYSVSVEATRRRITYTVTIDRYPAWLGPDEEIIAPDWCGHVESVSELARELVQECEEAMQNTPITVHKARIAAENASLPMDGSVVA